MQSTDTQQNRPALLIVDDEEMLARLLARGLSLAGFDVEYATNGEQALELLRDRAFDVLLTDINMPRLRGDDLQRLARAKRPDLIVFYITAEVDGDPETTLRPEVDGFFMKPFQLTDVAKEVRAAIARRDEKI